MSLKKTIIILRNLIISIFYYNRTNNQLLGGTKSDLLTRCLEGHSRGALPSCPEIDCGAKLNINMNTKVAYCAGKFNTEIGVFVKCFYTCPLDSIQRIPWKNKPSSQFEISNATVSSSSTVSTKGKEEEEENLFKDINMTTPEGKRQAVILAIEKARQLGINLPESESDAKY